VGRVRLAGAVVVDIDLELFVHQWIRQQGRAHAHRNSPDRTQAENAGESAGSGGCDGGRGVADAQSGPAQRDAAVHCGNGSSEPVEHLHLRFKTWQSTVAGRRQRGCAGAIEAFEKGQVGLRCHRCGDDSQYDGQAQSTHKRYRTEQHSALPKMVPAAEQTPAPPPRMAASPDAAMPARRLGPRRIPAQWFQGGH
jgi:hypothetical protein